MYTHRPADPEISIFCRLVAFNIIPEIVLSVGLYMSDIRISPRVSDCREYT